MDKSRSEELQHEAVDVFWETIPPFWQRVREHIRQVSAEQFDISVEQFQTLRGIRRGYCSVSELAEVKNISRPAISQAVDVLVNKGLIARTPDANDRRHIQLALTDSGNRLLDTIYDNTRQWMMQLFTVLDDEQLREFTRAMTLFRKIN